MKLTVDEQSDALYLRLDDSEITEEVLSIAVDDGIAFTRRFP